jgi:hypothetical protein
MAVKATLREGREKRVGRELSAGARIREERVGREGGLRRRLRSPETARVAGQLPAATGTGFSIGTPTMLPHSVQDPS